MSTVLIRTTGENVRWTLSGPAAQWVPEIIQPFLVRGTDVPGMSVIKKTMARTVLRMGPPAVPVEIVVKVHRCSRLGERLKHLLRPSKAAQEWNMAGALAGIGVATFRPLAYAERRQGRLLYDCCLVSEALPVSETLASVARGPMKLWTREERRRLLESVAALVRRMHEGKIVHNDLHAGNLLCQRRDRGMRLFVLDLHSVRAVRRVSARARRRNLMQLLASIMSFTNVEERQHLLKCYARGNPALVRFVTWNANRIERAAESYRDWVYRSRTARCLQQSSEFDRQNLEGATVHFRREFGPEAIRQALKEHRGVLAGTNGQLLKISPGRSVSIVRIPWEGQRTAVCVKESRSYTWREALESLFRGPKSRRIWMAAHGLTVRGVSACELLAAGERKRLGFARQCFVIMKALDDCVNLDHYVQTRLTCLEGPDLVRFKRAMAGAVGRFFAQLHDKRIYHRDLKPTNIMVRERGQDDWHFILIDLDRVRFDRDVSFRRRARNLAQVASHFQHRLTTTDGWRCVRAYMEASSSLRERSRFTEFVKSECEKTLQYNRRIIEQIVDELRARGQIPQRKKARVV